MRDTRFGAADPFWFCGGSIAAGWPDEVEATASFNVARSHALWAASFWSSDEPEPE
jgi:hypothetical protein